MTYYRLFGRPVIIFCLLLILIEKLHCIWYLLKTNVLDFFIIASYFQQRQLNLGGLGGLRAAQTYDPPEKDSSEDMITTNSEEESCTADDSAYTVQNPDNKIVYPSYAQFDMQYENFYLVLKTVKLKKCRRQNI